MLILLTKKRYVPLLSLPRVAKNNGDKGEEGKEKEEKQEDEAVMAETKRKKKIDSKMLKNILSLKQDELSNAAAEYQELREKAVRLNMLLFEPS